MIGKNGNTGGGEGRRNGASCASGVGKKKTQKVLKERFMQVDKKKGDNDQASLTNDVEEMHTSVVS